MPRVTLDGVKAVMKEVLTCQAALPCCRSKPIDSFRLNLTLCKLKNLSNSAASSQSKSTNMLGGCRPDSALRTGMVWVWPTRLRANQGSKLFQGRDRHTLDAFAKDLVERGGSMQQGRSNAFEEAMNGLLQNAKRAARGIRTSANFIAIAYLRLSKLKHLPANPFERAAPRFADITTHRC